MLNTKANYFLSINQQFIHSSSHWTVSKNRKRRKEWEIMTVRNETFGDDHKYLWLILVICAVKTYCSMFPFLHMTQAHTYMQYIIQLTMRRIPHGIIQLPLCHRISGLTPLIWHTLRIQFTTVTKDANLLNHAFLHLTRHATEPGGQC